MRMAKESIAMACSHQRSEFGCEFYCSRRLSSTSLADSSFLSASWTALNPRDQLLRWINATMSEEFMSLWRSTQSLRHDGKVQTFDWFFHETSHAGRSFDFLFTRHKALSLHNNSLNSASHSSPTAGCHFASLLRRDKESFDNNSYIASATTQIISMGKQRTSRCDGNNIKPRDASIADNYVKSFLLFNW